MGSRPVRSQQTGIRWAETSHPKARGREDVLMRSSNPHFDSRVAPGMTKVPSLLFSLFLPSLRLHWSFLYLLILRMREFLKSVPNSTLSGGSRTLLVQHVLHLTLLKDRNMKVGDGNISKQAGSLHPSLFFITDEENLRQQRSVGFCCFLEAVRFSTDFTLSNMINLSLMK